ncbi:MAG: hypothetical protein Q7R74_01760 [bacterium]|nr:hypothetical protein [bacterium]
MLSRETAPEGKSSRHKDGITFLLLLLAGLIGLEVAKDVRREVTIKGEMDRLSEFTTELLKSPPKPAP